MQALHKTFSAQQQHKFILRSGGATLRKAALRKLKKAIQQFEPELYAALQEDLRKSNFETAVTELLFTYCELDHAMRHLHSWMKPRRAGATLSSLFAKNRICYEPKGTCLIIAPWNYPFQLVMSPLISAIAAGNCVMVKPSELSPATGKVIEKIIETAFAPQEIACVQGDATVAEALLSLPFDHIFFTGSTAVGKVVMAAAAKNLTSVTLELGGKSPAIVDDTTDLKKAAEKIAWGKLVNAGQTCIAPDHVLIAATREAEFIRYYKAAAEKMFFCDGELNPGAYAKIINKKHFERLNGLAEDALKRGADITWIGKADQKANVSAPAILTNVGPGSKIMQEEIFGPLLPVIAFKHLEEAIGHVNAAPKPLALYLFSGSRQNIDKVLKHTSAGGTCVNDVLVHISNPKLPFGGVNNSGTGSCHGKFGFKAFSHERAVMYQSRFGVTRLIYPPYEGKNWVLKLLKKII